jgi:hypothetical protein
MKSNFNKFIIFLAVVLLSLTVYVSFTKKPKKELRPKINTVKTRKIIENDEVYNITLSNLKHCNYGENNINKENYNNYLYKDNYTLDTISLDQKFYCILSFVTKDDLGIKDDFDRKQLSTKIPSPLIQDKIKSIFNIKDYPKRSFKNIYLDRLGVYLDIIYEGDNYLFKAIYEESNQVKSKFNEVVAKYLTGGYKSVNNKEEIILKEKFVVIDVTFLGINNYKFKIYKNYKRDTVLKEYEGSQLITDDVIDSGSTITYKFNKINNKWYFKESIIK